MGLHPVISLASRTNSQRRIVVPYWRTRISGEERRIISTGRAELHSEKKKEKEFAMQCCLSCHPHFEVLYNSHKYASMSS